MFYLQSIHIQDETFYENINSTTYGSSNRHVDLIMEYMIQVPQLRSFTLYSSLSPSECILLSYFPLYQPSILHSSLINPRSPELLSQFKNVDVLSGSSISFVRNEAISESEIYEMISFILSFHYSSVLFFNIPAMVRFLLPSFVELSNIQVIITDRIKPKKLQSYKNNFTFLQSVYSIKDVDIICQSPKLLSILLTLPETYYNDENIFNIIVKLKNIMDNKKVVDVEISYEILFANLLKKNVFKNIIYKLYPSYNCWNIPEEYINYYKNNGQIFNNGDLKDIGDIPISIFRNFFFGLTYCSKLEYFTYCDLPLNTIRCLVISTCCCYYNNLLLLDLHNTNLTRTECSIISKSLKYLTNLKYLNLIDNPITDEGLECLLDNLPRKSSLEILNLENTMLTDGIIPIFTLYLSKLINCESIYADSNNILFKNIDFIEEFINVLNSMKKLKTFSITDNRIDKEGLKEINKYECKCLSVF